MSFAWIAPSSLGQGASPTPQAQCCEDLERQYPELFAATLSDDDQTDLRSLLAIARAGRLTAQDRTDLAELQAACCTALRTTGTPQGASVSTLALQRQINQILSAHGCQIDADGILGKETCGAVALISERQWGSVLAPDACSSFAAVEPTGCRDTAAPAKKRGAGAGIFLLAAAALLGIGFALAGRG